MTVSRHICVSIACNVCSEPLTDEDIGVPHFASADAARVAYGRGYGWIIFADGFALCDTEDQAHREAVAALLPAFGPPVLDGQTELPFDDHSSEVQP